MGLFDYFYTEPNEPTESSTDGENLRDTLRDLSLNSESEQLAKGTAREIYNLAKNDLYSAASHGNTDYQFLPQPAQPTNAFTQEQLSKQVRELFFQEELTVTLNADFSLLLSWN